MAVVKRSIKKTAKNEVYLQYWNSTGPLVSLTGFDCTPMALPKQEVSAILEKTMTLGPLTENADHANTSKKKTK